MPDTITTFTHSNLDPILKDIRAALMTVGEKHGLKFHIGKTTYANKNFKTPLTCVIAETDEAGDNLSATEIQARNEFLTLLDVHGIPKAALETEFKLNGDRCIIRGFIRKRRAYPVLFKNLTTGALKKCPLENAKAFLKMNDIM